MRSAITSARSRRRVALMAAWIASPKRGERAVLPPVPVGGERARVPHRFGVGVVEGVGGHLHRERRPQRAVLHGAPVEGGLAERAEVLDDLCGDGRQRRRAERCRRAVHRVARFRDGAAHVGVFPQDRAADVEQEVVAALHGARHRERRVDEAGEHREHHDVVLGARSHAGGRRQAGRGRDVVLPGLRLLGGQPGQLAGPVGVGRGRAEPDEPRHGTQPDGHGESSLHGASSCGRWSGIEPQECTVQVLVSWPAGGVLGGMAPLPDPHLHHPGGHGRAHR